MLFCLFISKLSNITGKFTAFYRFFSFIPKFFPTFASQQMRFIHILCLAFMLSATNAMTSVHAQTKTNYFLHTVTKGQSLYSIASMYNVSINDIVRMNPDSKQQIKTGQTLKIPQAVTDGDNKHPRFHTIQSGETLYRLTLQYTVSAEAICAANPGLSAKNFRAGQVIIIPANKEEKKPEQPEKSEDTVQQQKWQEMHKVARKETIFSISRQ